MRRGATVALLLLAAGCGSKIDEDYQVGSGGFHPFTDTDEHGEWLAAHGYDFTACTDCHGADLRGQAVGAGGEMLRSCGISSCHRADDGELFACNLCHGDEEGDPSSPLAWAPPEDLEGAIDASAPGVGAHQSHLGAPSGISAAVPCGTCHVVPAVWDEPGHLGEGSSRAEVRFGGIADDEASYNFASNTCATTYCHGDEGPLWTEVDGTWSECGSCHGLAPEEDHRPVTDISFCVVCHGMVVNEDGEIIAPELHINGEVDEE